MAPPLLVPQDSSFMIRALFWLSSLCEHWTMGGQLPKCFCCQWSHKSVEKWCFWPWKQNLCDWSARWIQFPVLFRKHLSYYIHIGPRDRGWIPPWLGPRPSGVLLGFCPFGKSGKQKRKLEGREVESLVPAGEELQESSCPLSNLHLLPTLSFPFQPFNG